MPPTAVITRHTTTSPKQAGTIISLSATDSTLGTGRWHTHKIEWTVDHAATGGGTWNALLVRDPRIAANVDAAQHFRGFNFEFLADEPGDYEITLTVTDETGASDTDAVTINIPAATRTDYYVDTTGSDTTGNGSQSTPWATVHKALTTLNGTNNWRVNLRAGQVHTFQPTVEPFSLNNCTNIEIGRYGTGADPIIVSHTVLRFGTGTENYYVHNLRMRSSEAITDEVNTDHAFSISGSHGIFSDIVIEGTLTGNGFKVPFFLDTAFGASSHVCLLRCTTQATRDYSLVNQGGNPRNISCIGCSFGPSLIESCVRFLNESVDLTAFFCCDADTSDPLSALKSTIRFQWAKWGSCYRCRLRGGDCRIGQILTGSGWLGFAQHIRIDACRMRGSDDLPAFQVSDNLDGFAIVNNYIEISEAVSALSLQGLDEGTRRGLIAHNTFDNVMGGAEDSGCLRGLLRQSADNSLGRRGGTRAAVARLYYPSA